MTLVHFSCEHCGQRLKTRTDRRHSSRCPKCGGQLVIPAVPAAASRSREEESGEEFDFAFQDPGPTRAPTAASSSRYVPVWRGWLYAQGLLLAVVGGTAFVLGFLAGQTTVPPRLDPRDARPAILAGRVTYRGPSGAPRPDAGAVILCLPQGERPGLAEKVSVEGLRPPDPLPHADHPALQMIRQLGGVYVRSNEQGDFRVRLPETGEYFLLVLSKNASGHAPDARLRADLAQLGRYFHQAHELIVDRPYKWQPLEVHRDLELSLEF